MLCSRCHRELHSELWKLEEINLHYFEEAKCEEIKNIVTGSCPICGKDVYWGNKCCSKNCAARLARNVHWPQDEAFLEIYTNNSRRQAAKMLNVSIAGLQKHFKRIKRATPDLHGEPTG